MGILLISGREFTRADDENAPRVAVVNQTMMARYWGGQNPIGQRLHLKDYWVRVVGVVKDSKYYSMEETPRPFFYVPLRQNFAVEPDIHIRTTQPPRGIEAALIREVPALEIVLSGDDFDADIAERYGWVSRTLDDADLDSFVDALVRRLASFDRETLAAAKAQVDRFGTPTASELQSISDLFFPLLALLGAQARRAKIRGIGYGVASGFELNFGRYLPSFGPADEDATGLEK